MSRTLKCENGFVAGVAGLAAGVAALVTTAGWEMPIHARTAMVLGATALAATAVDQFMRRRSGLLGGLHGAPRRSLDVGRVAKKLVVFYLILFALYLAHWVNPALGGYFSLFWDAFFLVLPGIVIASPFYVAFVDRRQDDPHDAYVDAFEMLCGGEPRDRPALGNFAIGWLVKAFFLPIMFLYLAERVDLFLVHLPHNPFETFNGFHQYYLNLLALFELMIAVVGYIMTFRLFDSHIRSAEPTWLGWAVCLACYQPFWSLTEQYFAYEQDGLFWSDFFWNLPVVYYTWGTVILMLVTIVVVSTVMFGIRFSNLTHRGIITSGLYRWTKHPGYLAKNASWWLISVPFFAATGDWFLSLLCCVLLGGVNLIYFMRAVTEERHLARDPAYREYQAFIAEHGIVAVVRRAAGRLLLAGARRATH